MARYISLLRYTDQGVKQIKKSPTRAAAFRKAVEKSGVIVESQLWTAGSCDGVLILRGEENKVLRWLAQLAALGNVRTETLQAFDVEAFSEIVGK